MFQRKPAVMPLRVVHRAQSESRGPVVAIFQAQAQGMVGTELEEVVGLDDIDVILEVYATG
jgi:hypothetical protein